MTEISKAAFTFSDFRIKTFSYNEGINMSEGLKIEINPSGEYYPLEGKYILNLHFTGTEDAEKGDKIIDVHAVAMFLFATPLPFKEMPEYFYQNAIAIFFPYLRAFISTMTLQANTAIITLNTMNLSKLTPILKENTKCIS